MTPVSTTQALACLKAVQPKTYKRNDLDDESTRIGFIAQDVEASLPPEWANIVGSTGGVEEHVDEEGTTVPAKASTLLSITVDWFVVSGRLIATCWRALKHSKLLLPKSKWERCKA